MRPICVYALTLLSGLTVSAAEYNGPRSVTELQSQVERILQRTGTPGAAVALVSRDKVKWIAGLGKADVAAGIPVTKSTLFRLGSISKEFVALSALKLEERGKLKLTDTLRQWIPEISVDNPWESTDPVRLVHLLEHTAGIPDWHFSEMANNDSTPLTLTEALVIGRKYRQVRWRPGSRYAYSNVDPALAAAIIEKASGMRFEDFVAETFFRPLGMTSTDYFLSRLQESPAVTMYWRRSNAVAPYTNLIYRPAGSIVSSISDMANYVQFHLGRGSFHGQQILRESSMDRLEIPTTLPAAIAGVTTGYGLYNRAVFVRGYEWHGHDGAWDAGLAQMIYCPELGIGLVIMINSNNGSTLGQITNLLVRYATREFPEKKLPPNLNMPSSFTARYDGYYTNISPRNEGFLDFGEYFRNLRRIQVRNDSMLWEDIVGGRTQKWLPISGKLFRRENTSKPALALIEDENGQTLFQSNEGTFRRISTITYFVSVRGLEVSLILLASAIIFALVWGSRLLAGRPKDLGPLSIMLWPLLGSLAVLGFLGFFYEVQEGWTQVLGRVNIWTIGVMLTTLLIPLSAMFSMILCWKHRKSHLNRFVYWHAVSVTLALAFISGFAAMWHIIGIRTWA